MKTATRSNLLTTTGLLLALPTAFIIVIAMLKYELGIPGPFDGMQPTLESWGIKDPPGLNINLLILFGPIIGFVLTIFQVLRIRLRFEKKQVEINTIIQAKWFPLLVAGFSLTVLGCLSLYMFGENCTC
jgi:hypothetical protein